MRRCAVLAAGKLLVAAGVLLLALSAFAQQGTTIAVSARSFQIAELLERGKQLEAERRWGDALSHYEEAMRTFPGEESLRRRFATARAHYDVARRYADRSFQDALDQITPSRALEFYGQVLLKIHAHYVDMPSWSELVEQGTRTVEAALSEPIFLARHLPNVQPAAVERYCRELRSGLASRPLQSRHDARDAAAWAAQLAQQQLRLAATAVILEYACGAVGSLDTYSTYLTADQLNEVYSQIEGNFVGLGIELKTSEGALSVVRVIPGSPAHRAGIRPGERIVSVDGRSTERLSPEETANLLQGREDSEVQVGVAAPGQPPRLLRIRRQRIEVPSIERAEMLDPHRGVAYLHLACFQKTTCRDLDAALWKLHREGMRSLVIDLRGNPGGLLIAAVDAADRFIERGIIVSTRGRNSQEDYTYWARPEGTWRMPLVVLIDQQSASAAEIFAGAIRDHRRGIVVGARSFGKGTIQGIFPLEMLDAGVRLTTAKFYSPSGRPYNILGVEPDVAVRVAARPHDKHALAEPTEADPFLAAALEAASNLNLK